MTFAKIGKLALELGSMRVDGRLAIKYVFVARLPCVACMRRTMIVSDVLTFESNACQKFWPVFDTESHYLIRQ